MVPLSRRRLLAAAGVTALSGCLSRDEPSEDGSEGADDGSDDAGELDPNPLPEDVRRAFEYVPEQVGDASLALFNVVQPDDASDDDPTTAMAGGYQARAVGIDSDDLDVVVSGSYGSYVGQVTVLVGDVRADDVDPDAVDEPYVGEVATHVEDGLAVLATRGEEPWSAGVEAATIAAEDSALGVRERLPVAALLDPVSTRTLVTVLRPDVTDEASDDLDLENVELVAFSREPVDETTQSITVVAGSEDEDAPDREVLEDLLADLAGASALDDVAVETTAWRAVATASVPLPEHDLPDDSPDLHVAVGYAGDGTAELEAQGTDPADPSNLEVRVDESSVEAPWAQRSDPIEPDETFTLHADLLDVVEVRWHDPEREDVVHTLGRRLLGSHVGLFERSYDADGEELTLTYAYEEPLDPADLELVHRGPETGFDESDGELLSERVDELAAGTEIEVDDVEYGDTVVVRAAAERDGHRYLVSEHVRPPGHFEHVREDGDSFVVYRGEEERSADRYRLTVPDDGAGGGTDAEPTSTQWSDEYDTLTPGDRLEVDAELGTTLRVEWAPSDGDLLVDALELAPDVSVDATVDEAAGEVQLTHDGGEPVPAAELSVREFGPELTTHEDAFADEDTVEVGDATTIDLASDLDADADDAEGPRHAIVVDYRDATVATVRLPEGEATPAAGDAD